MPGKHCAIHGVSAIYLSKFPRKTESQKKEKSFFSTLANWSKIKSINDCCIKDLWIWLSLSCVPWFPAYKWRFIYLEKCTQSLETRLRMKNLTRSRFVIGDSQLLWHAIYSLEMKENLCNSETNKNLNIKWFNLLIVKSMKPVSNIEHLYE